MKARLDVSNKVKNKKLLMGEKIVTIERQADSLLTTVGASAPYKAAVTVFGIAAGVLASLYADEIVKAHYLLIGKGTISWPATSFWITVALAAILFFFGQQASDTRPNHSEEWRNAPATPLAPLVRQFRP